MCVVVNVLEAGLVHVLVGVLGPVFVGMRVLVCHMVVLMRGVRVCMGRFTMLVFVRMRAVMGVLVGHGCHPRAEYVVVTGLSPGSGMLERSACRW